MPKTLGGKAGEVFYTSGDRDDPARDAGVSYGSLGSVAVFEEYTTDDTASGKPAVMSASSLLSASFGLMYGCAKGTYHGTAPHPMYPHGGPGMSEHPLKRPTWFSCRIDGAEGDESFSGYAVGWTSKKTAWLVVAKDEKTARALGGGPAGGGRMNRRRVAIVGAGPTGLYLAIALARRNHRVIVVDRDRGPAPDGSWGRKGVMQFHHPHGFRGQVVDALTAEMPEVLDAMITAGAVPATIPALPGRIVGLRCRRELFERVLRGAAEQEPGVELRLGHAERPLADRGRVTGLVVDGQRVDADMVIDASGRVGRLGQGLRAPARGGDCGLAYVSRQYVLLPGAEEGPVNSPMGLVANLDGYQVVVFPHDNRTFSTLIARLASDRHLAQLRDERAFDVACRAIPALTTWTRPDRSRPITSVLPGGRLTNSYQGQRDAAGAVALPGLIFVGDAVCTTTPTAGRGVATSLMQAQQLLFLLDRHGTTSPGARWPWKTGATPTSSPGSTTT